MSRSSVYSGERSSMRDVLGPLVALPASSGDQTGYVTIRSIVPAGTLVPLHSHADRETIVVVDGELEVWSDGSWRTFAAGDVADIHPDVRHALRNGGTGDVSLVLVTTGRMASFFDEVALAAGSPPDMSEERLGHFLATAAAYGYWNGGPDEQGLLGLTTAFNA
jgi:quercetin dioxygenase-like cupin family protein